MPLRTPTLLNVAWVPRPGWTGHFRSLEAVAFGPITSPGNMNLPEAELIKRLLEIPGYVRAFHTAFGDGKITRQNIELALATFQRSIVSGEAPFDRWIKGDEGAISEAAKRGFDLFNGKAHCASCHSGWAFTNSSFHDIGTAKGDDIGRGKLFPTFGEATLCLQDSDLARYRAARALYARRIGNDPGRSDRSLRQGRYRPAEPFGTDLSAASQSI